ncbi:MAG: DUF2304 domain-containing protein [Ethanoligenens sp.]|uniref:DUF2304 domain-containing protein n=1 Tax=Ethanoligenens sp. TaxID=2099655 RepID=UPI0039ECB701
MSIVLRTIILVLGLFYFISVFHLLVRKQISERNSIKWLIASVVVLIFSVFPGILDPVARLCGIDYPPALLFLAAILILMFITFRDSVTISVMNDQIKQLTQYIAVHERDWEGDTSFLDEQKNAGFAATGTSGRESL